MTRSCWSWSRWRSWKPPSVYKLPGDDTPIIVGSALKALEGDTSEIGVPAVVSWSPRWYGHHPVPKREIEKLFLMPSRMSSAFQVVALVTGRIERGIVKINDEVEIIGLEADGEDHVHGR